MTTADLGFPRHTNNPDCNSSFRQTSGQLTEFDGKTKIFYILNPLGRSTKLDNMGFKPSVTTVQSTRFKRKLASTASTPPATPFNNTSFLIRLQQLREQCNPKRLRFDQYGSMEHVINYSFFATPQNPAHSSMANKIICSPKSPKDPNWRNHTCQELSSCCSDGASSSAMGEKTGKHPGMREPDGVRHHQHFVDDNFDIHSRKRSRELPPPV